MTKDIHIDAEVFKGPMDLLLYLTKKEEIDIHEISIKKITDKYLQYLEDLQNLNINLAAEFTSMAAYLMYLKSLSLLPEKPKIEDDIDIDDPFQKLVIQLLEYKKFKEFSSELEQKAIAQQGIYSNYPIPYSRIEKTANLEEVSIQELWKVFQETIKRIQEENRIHEISEEPFSIDEKIKEIMSFFHKEKSILITTFFPQNKGKNEIITIFLALLELLKEKKLYLFQYQKTKEIQLRLATERPNDWNQPTSNKEE